MNPNEHEKYLIEKPLREKIATLKEEKERWIEQCRVWENREMKHNQEREEVQKECARLKAENEELLELVAGTNGDGGHYHAEHGTKKAVEFGLKNYYGHLEQIGNLEYERNRLTASLAMANEALETIASKTYETVDVDSRTHYEWPTKEARIAQKALQYKEGSLAFEKWKKMEVICKKSVGWWLGKRPTNYTKQMHLENPDINCPTKSEQKLAKAVAEFESLDAKGERE